MTWVTSELVWHPGIMKELQKEGDEFFEYQNGRDPVYQDLYRPRVMNRRITEVMRDPFGSPGGTHPRTSSEASDQKIGA